MLPTSIRVPYPSLMDVCVCVPIYNDWENASLLIENFIANNFQGVALLIVDNGSNQESPEALKRYFALGNVSLLRLETNQGFGGAIQQASRSLTGDWFVWMPGNMKVIPTDLIDFFELVKSSSPSDFIKAQRIERPAVDQLKTFVASMVQTIASGKLMLDTGGTPSAVHRDNPLRESMISAPGDYRFESFMLFTAKQEGIKVVRPKVRYRRRIAGKSHWQTGTTAEIKLMISLVSSIINWKRAAARKSEESGNG